ncbi:unnamed protein product [Moneuplotes crassus]|uniref:Protein kinase domain-containing protein n=2 Tax=Euplotes crassus TaxID=5936 RepID=A0AAD1U066_EUPCR|nr:unnamed protein product [Moneuplotes crassus]
MESRENLSEKSVSSKTISHNIDLLSMSKKSVSSTSLRKRVARRRQFSSLSVSTNKEDSSDEGSSPSYDLKKNYNIIKSLGCGTYALVQLAEEKGTGRQVAIKISRGINSRDLLKSEYDILSKVSHERIIKPLSFQENSAKKESYLIMEYFEGQNLNEFIEENGVLGQTDARLIFNQLLSAVEALHSARIAHRDIKPENILVNKDLQIKLVDFNISKVYKPLKEDEKTKFSSIFYTHISTPLYAAPELRTSIGYTESIDIWGLGIVLLSMLCGTLQDEKLPSGTAERMLSLQGVISLKIEESKCSEFLLSLLSEDPEERPIASECRLSSWMSEE